MLVLNVNNFEKFTVGGNAFQTFITRSTKAAHITQTAQ